MPVISVIRSILFCAVFTVVFAIALPCDAETTYRWVTGKGETVYSDQPPPPGIQFERIEGNTQGSAPAYSYATRLAAEKYPVTLYTSVSCKEICAGARTLLNGRGVPFSEKLISTPQEFAEAGKRMGAEMTIPSLSVGSQNFLGFEAASWNSLLDLAGYPETAPYGSRPSGAFPQ